MKIYFKEINGTKDFDIAIDLKKLNEEYESSTIKKINSLSGTIKANKVDDILILDFQIDSNLTLISSYSLKDFDKDFSVDDTLYFTDEEECASEDTLLVKNEIDIDNIVYSLLVTSLPIKLYADDEKVIKGNGYRVLKEGEEDEENDESSPFDVLKDIEL
ncbi:MAG: DUF177 domain-containing protein [Bacilli bacterium]|nr:DUF177 domain-containing protein [Bacilli bacterium]